MIERDENGKRVYPPKWRYNGKPDTGNPLYVLATRRALVRRSKHKAFTHKPQKGRLPRP